MHQVYLILNTARPNITKMFIVSNANSLRGEPQFFVVLFYRLYDSRNSSSYI